MQQKNVQYNLMGAICGDCIGSRFEWKSFKDIPQNFELLTKKTRWTDDTCLTVAIAEAVLKDGNYEKYLKKYTKQFPDRGYGKMYMQWANKKEFGIPYSSYANGGAMRLSPVPLYFVEMQKVFLETVRSTAVTHNHPKAIDSSLLLSTAIFLARSIKDKEYINQVLYHNFKYETSKFLDYSKDAKFRVKDSLLAEAAVWFALDCFFLTTSYEEAVRRAVRAGGDTDTVACLTGSVAFAYYEKMPQKLHDQVFNMLPPKFQSVIKEFHKSCVKNQLRI